MSISVGVFGLFATVVTVAAAAGRRRIPVGGSGGGSSVFSIGRWLGTFSFAFPRHTNRDAWKVRKAKTIVIKYITRKRELTSLFHLFYSLT